MSSLARLAEFGGKHLPPLIGLFLIFALAKAAFVFILTLFGLGFLATSTVGLFVLFLLMVRGLEALAE